MKLKPGKAAAPTLEKKPAPKPPMKDENRKRIAAIRAGYQNG